MFFLLPTVSDTALSLLLLIDGIAVFVSSQTHAAQNELEGQQNLHLSGTELLQAWSCEDTRPAE